MAAAGAGDLGIAAIGPTGQSATIPVKRLPGFPVEEGRSNRKDEGLCLSHPCLTPKGRPLPFCCRNRGIPARSAGPAHDAGINAGTYDALGLTHKRPVMTRKVVPNDWDLRGEDEPENVSTLRAGSERLTRLGGKRSIIVRPVGNRRRNIGAGGWRRRFCPPGSIVHFDQTRRRNGPEEADPDCLEDSASTAGNGLRHNTVRQPGERAV